MRVRIEDVANQAGVSMKTVSRVLNNEPGVREATRAKVLKKVITSSAAGPKAHRRRRKQGTDHDR